ncbi:MAG: hypothetical protein SFV24_16090 [Gemmatimonadales bacterium]|nr:hypothetical protein [Gemmatimonadota bacterium]MCC7134142.1 hypothetical protein [Gemmatimonadales bacterium]MDX2059331.1 hypothetical protein [Gemmatimonadales bacterium]
MSWAQRGLIAGVVGLGALIVMSKTGGKKAGLDPEDSPLKGAVYATAIPVWEDAKLTDITGGNYYNDIGGPVTFTSKSWFFKLSDPVTEVADFYRKNLPAGAKPTEAEDGAVAFEWLPPGAKEGEEVSVTVREGELQISETVKAPGT